MDIETESNEEENFDDEEENIYDKELDEQIEKINNREDFLKFLQLLNWNLQKNKENWENPTLESYLEAVEAFTASFDGFRMNNPLEPGEEDPSWKTFAYILAAGAVYE